MFNRIIVIMVTCLLSFISGCSSSNNTTIKPAIGTITAEQLFAHQPIFQESFQQKVALQGREQLVEQWPEDLHIEVFFGTWCHDSKREVPKFLALMAKHPQVSYQLTALDYKKQDPLKLAQSHRVKFTPTFIVKKANKEIGRIVEYTKQSFVKDISEMLKVADKS